MAAGTTWKFTKNRITSKRFIRLAPGLATFDQKRTAYKIPCYNFIIFKHKMAADGHFKFDSWTISVFFHWSSPQATIVDRFGRVIRQNACLDASRCLFGFTKIQSSVFTPQIPKNAILVPPMHFLWKTKILITFQSLITEQSNFTSLIPCIYSTIIHCQKIEFQNPRWPTAPFWIFKILLKFEYLLNR